MLLENKIAVIYGAGGAVGSVVTRTFAREGAKVFMVGRTARTLDAVAKDIPGTEVDEVDAMDEQAVAQHLDAVVAKAGRIDISFNLIGLGDEQGTPIHELTYDAFSFSIDNAMKSHFYTAKAAAHHMIRQKSGVLVALTANASRGAYPNLGGFSVACAAIEGLWRQFAADLGVHGVRAVVVRSAGSPDTPGLREVFELHAKNAGVSFDEFLKEASSGALLKRMPMLAEVANAAAFLASDYASGMTAAVANLTCGQMVD